MRKVGLRHRAASAVAAIWLSLSAVATGGISHPAIAAVAPCTVQFGMYDTNTPWDPTMTSIRNLDTAIGRHSSIVHWYAQWGDAGSGNFAANQPWMLKAVRNYSSVGVTGSTPLITWEAWGPSPMTVANNTFPLTKIAAGAFDPYIDSWAVGLRTYGAPVLLDFGHEMDGNWYPWGNAVNGNTPAQYVAAFRHVHDRFVAAGATNVQFVWNPNVWNPAGVDQRVFYPGDAYVDWMAIDVYNWGANGGGWASLAQGLTVVQTYARVAGLNAKPMMLAEYASAEPVAGDPAGVTKGQWIIDAAGAMGAQFPRLKAAIWFNQEGGTFALNSSGGSMAGAASAFGGCGSTQPPPPPPPPPSPVPTPVSTPPPSPVPSHAPSPVPSHAPSPVAGHSPSPVAGHSPSPAAAPPTSAGRSPAPSAAPPAGRKSPSATGSPKSAAAATKASPQATRLAAYNSIDPGTTAVMIGGALVVLAFLSWAIQRALVAVFGKRLKKR